MKIFILLALAIVTLTGCGTSGGNNNPPKPPTTNAPPKPPVVTNQPPPIVITNQPPIVTNPPAQWIHHPVVVSNKVNGVWTVSYPAQIQVAVKPNLGEPFTFPRDPIQVKTRAWKVQDWKDTNAFWFVSRKQYIQIWGKEPPR